MNRRWLWVFIFCCGWLSVRPAGIDSCDAPCRAWVDSVYQTLSPEQRIGQFFMLPAYTSGALYNMPEVVRLIGEGKAGGVIFFKGSPPDQVRFTQQLNDTARVLPWISIDGEWGLAMRLENTVCYPHQLTLGAIQDDRLIEEMGFQIGQQCRRMGLQVNFAPAVDINTNPLNPVIGDRSFGEDKYKVALKGLAYAEGLQRAGVLACAKHFPGHGDTDKDSHHELPSVMRGRTRLFDQELYPFNMLFRNGVGSVMVAHLHVPALDTAAGSIASLSPRITTQLLQDSLGFNGLIFSDALNMKGVSKTYPPGMVDSMAFVAGNDILVFSQDCASGIQKIQAAVDSGAISQETLTRRVKKVLGFKYRLGLHTKPNIPLLNVEDDLNKPEYVALTQQLYNAAMTFAANDSHQLPLRNTQNLRMASLSIRSGKLTSFQQHLNAFAPFDWFQLIRDDSEKDFAYFTDTLKKYDLVVVDLHSMVKSAEKNYGLAKPTIRFLRELADSTRVIITLFGSPYALRFFEGFPELIMAYEDNAFSQRAAANALFGAIPVTGTLPVTASARFPIGCGSRHEETFRLRIGQPEESGYRANDFREMDDLVLKAILQRATPGAQLLVAKDNAVLWQQAYGNLQYDTGLSVNGQTHYDLASITKVAATTLAVMKLYENAELDIYEKVGTYLPLPDSNTVANIRIADLLLHQSGLSPFLRFHPQQSVDSFLNYFRPVASDSFATRVSHNLFLRSDYPDSMWVQMVCSPVQPLPGYVYSDINFYILQRIVEQITRQPLHLFMEETFYKPMNLHRLGFLPLRFADPELIAPSEVDQDFRRCQLQGTVNDPGAAMCGGVAGHAGLFGNAFDLAQLFQLLLNGGEYNGVSFLRPETIAFFTQSRSTISRRALGFDKPEPEKGKVNPCSDNTPPSAFGHTGFTGTCVWADPKNNMVYVFLSNRTYPNAKNNLLVKLGVRSAIQDLIYRYLPVK